MLHVLYLELRAFNVVFLTAGGLSLLSLLFLAMSGCAVWYKTKGDAILGRFGTTVQGRVILLKHEPMNGVFRRFLRKVAEYSGTPKLNADEWDTFRITVCFETGAGVVSITKSALLPVQFLERVTPFAVTLRYDAKNPRRVYVEDFA